MDHAEARERLADALLAPRDGGLEAALADPSATSVNFRAHLAACAPCSRELDALRAMGALLATAAPDSLAAPPSLRARVMAAVGETGAPAAAPIPLRPRRRLLPLAAAMAAAVVLAAGSWLSRAPCPPCRRVCATSVSSSAAASARGSAGCTGAATSPTGRARSRGSPCPGDPATASSSRRAATGCPCWSAGRRRARLRHRRPGGYDARHGARRQHDHPARRDGQVRADAAR